MADVPSSRIARFGAFEADFGTGELRKGGVRIRLSGQPFEVLALLLERPGEAVSREELQQRLWPTDTFVDFDHGVNTAINRLREALGDSADNPRFIETVPRRGYRFIAPVGAKAPPADATSAAAEPSDNSAAAVMLPPEEVPAAAELISGTSGRSRKKLAWFSIAIFAASIAVAAVAYLVRFFGHADSPRIQSLAVLPLANLSNGSDQDFFADGMTEALTTDLGKISALRVISRTSVMRYKGTNKPLPDIAKELNVDAVVDGTVARSGNHVRITANLVQASPEKHLWAETYESEVGDILTVQGEVAQAVAREIQVKLTPEEKKLLGSARAVNPKAHDDYLKGHYLCDADTREGLDKGIQLLQQATAEDPNDPLAFAALADCYALWAWAGDIFAGDLTPKDVLPQAREAAMKSLQLDESSAEAHTSLANVKFVLDWDWPAAEKEFKRGIELNPSSPEAHMWYAHFLVAMNRFDESGKEAARAIELDPYSEYVTDFSNWDFYLARRYDLALRQSEKGQALFPRIGWARYHAGLVYEQTGRGGDSIAEFMKAEELFGMSARSLAELHKAYQQSGARGYWRKYLSMCEDASAHPRKFANSEGFGWCDYLQDADLAALHVRLGETQAALDLLEKGFANHGDALVYLKVDPYWDAIRAEPRFHDLVHRVGLPN